MSSAGADHSSSSPKSKKGNTMSPAPSTATANTRTSQQIERSQVSYQQLVKITPEEIAERAYELFMARGGTHGNDLDDWLRAESELLGARGMRQPNA
jgi:Protein of unknown function (DUF2934)